MMNKCSISFLKFSSIDKLILRQSLYYLTVHKKVEAATVDFVAKKSLKSSSNHNASSSENDALYKPTVKRKSTDNSSKELEAVSMLLYIASINSKLRFTHLSIVSCSQNLGI